jgi:hypothetical protein
MSLWILCGTPNRAKIYVSNVTNVASAVAATNGKASIPFVKPQRAVSNHFALVLVPGGRGLTKSMFIVAQGNRASVVNSAGFVRCLRELSLACEANVDEVFHFRTHVREEGTFAQHGSCPLGGFVAGGDVGGLNHFIPPVLWYAWDRFLRDY